MDTIQNLFSQYKPSSYTPTEMDNTIFAALQKLDQQMQEFQAWIGLDLTKPGKDLPQVKDFRYRNAVGVLDAYYNRYYVRTKEPFRMPAAVPHDAQPQIILEEVDEACKKLAELLQEDRAQQEASKKRGRGKKK